MNLEIYGVSCTGCGRLDSLEIETSPTRLLCSDCGCTVTAKDIEEQILNWQIVHELLRGLKEARRKTADLIRSRKSTR